MLQISVSTRVDRPLFQMTLKRTNICRPCTSPVGMQGACNSRATVEAYHSQFKRYLLHQPKGNPCPYQR